MFLQRYYIKMYSCIPVYNYLLLVCAYIKIRVHLQKKTSFNLMLYVIAYPIVAKNNSHTFHFFSSKQGSRLHSRGVVCWGHTLGQSLVQGGGAQ